MKLTWKALLLALLLPALALAAETEVTIDGGKAPLHGTLLTAEKPSVKAAALIIPGSGPTDRNGNSPLGVNAGTLKQLADALAAQGISSLRFDKRGIAASAPAMVSESELTFGIGVDDVVQWTRFLQARPGVSCVVLVGHSEGALIATLAAKRVNVCGIVSLAGPGRSGADVLRAQLTAAPMPNDLRQKALGSIDQLLRGETVTDVPTSLQSLFRPSAQPYMRSWLPIEPARELEQVRVPVLIIQGKNDIQIGAEDASLLAKARPDATLLLLDGVNHVLKASPAERNANIATYADASLPLDPRVSEAVVSFIRSKARGPDQ